MEHLIVFGFPIALAVASGWRGDDNRDRVHAQEEELISNGVSWWNPPNARDGQDIRLTEPDENANLTGERRD